MAIKTIAILGQAIGIPYQAKAILIQTIAMAIKTIAILGQAIAIPY
ncbi:MAG TPA: hypothetical protein VF411_15970 [Bacteroidia bacterium]